MTLKPEGRRPRRATPRAANGLVAALCLAAGMAQAYVPVVTYNTGTTAPVPGSTLAAPGAIDAHYQLVATPNGAPTGAAAVAGPVLPSHWLQPGGSSGWIQPAFHHDGTVPPTYGTSYFQTTFNLSGLDPDTAQFSGHWSVDDPGGAIYLNGQDLNLVGGNYIGSHPNGATGFAIYGSSPASNLVAGVNTLTFAVTRVPGPVFTGGPALRVEYFGAALPVPEPAAWALMALGLAGIGVARRRPGLRLVP